MNGLRYLWERAKVIWNGAELMFVPPPLNVQRARAKLIFEFFADPSRLGPIGACGMVAQAQGESAFDPCAIGDHGNALGLWQLWPGRRATAKDGIRNHAGQIIMPGTGIDVDALVAAKDNSDAAVIAQCKVAWWELQHVEKRALRALKAATTPYSAGHDAEVYYERSKTPGDPDKRGKFADEWAKTFGVAAS